MNIIQDENVQEKMITLLIFLIIAQPKIYKITNSYFNNHTDCPTLISKLIHIIIFFILTIIMLYFVKKTLNNYVLIKYALISSLLFFFLSSPELYNLTDEIFKIETDINCPNQKSIMLHGIIFWIINYYLL
jgi:Na+/melibiose symporter-like transporter